MSPPLPSKEFTSESEPDVSIDDDDSNIFPLTTATSFVEAMLGKTITLTLAPIDCFTCTEYRSFLIEPHCDLLSGSNPHSAVLTASLEREGLSLRYFYSVEYSKSTYKID